MAASDDVTDDLLACALQEADKAGDAGLVCLVATAHMRHALGQADPDPRRLFWSWRLFCKAVEAKHGADRGARAQDVNAMLRVFADRAASPQQSADKAGSQGWDDLWKAMAIAAWDLGVEELSAHEDAASVRRGTVSLARAAGFARRVVRPDRIARQVRLDALVGAATAALWLHLDSPDDSHLDVSAQSLEEAREVLQTLGDEPWDIADLQAGKQRAAVLEVLLACSRRRVDRPHLDKAVAEVLSLGDVDPRALVFLARYLGGRGAGDDADGDAMRLLREAIRRKASGDAKDSARTRALCVMAALAVRSGRDAPPVFAEVARAVQASQANFPTREADFIVAKCYNLGCYMAQTGNLQVATSLLQEAQGLCHAGSDPAKAQGMIQHALACIARSAGGGDQGPGNDEDPPQRHDIDGPAKQTDVIHTSASHHDVNTPAKPDDVDMSSSPDPPKGDTTASIAAPPPALQSSAPLPAPAAAVPVSGPATAPLLPTASPAPASPSPGPAPKLPATASALRDSGASAVTPSALGDQGRMAGPAHDQAPSVGADEEAVDGFESCGDAHEQAEEGGSQSSEMGSEGVHEGSDGVRTGSGVSEGVDEGVRAAVGQRASAGVSSLRSSPSARAYQGSGGVGISGDELRSDGGALRLDGEAETPEVAGRRGGARGGAPADSVDRLDLDASMDVSG